MPIGLVAWMIGDLHEVCRVLRFELDIVKYKKTTNGI
jgi:hypothetical protein